MPDPVWYYARGETENGPLTTAQIKALAAAGKIRPDDFVWKEGMDNWVPAADIQELFPSEAARSKDKEEDQEGTAPDTNEVPAERGSPRPFPGTAAAIAPQAAIRIAGRAVLLLGFAAVLLTRGCDALGDRYVARLQAMAIVAEGQFQAEWTLRRRQLEDQIEPLRVSSNGSPANQETLKKLTTRLAALEEEKRARESELRRTSWHDLQNAAEQVEANYEIGAFWRELAFFAGTILLAAGLLAVGYTSEGPERWLCFVALAILLYGVCAPHASGGH